MNLRPLAIALLLLAPAGARAQAVSPAPVAAETAAPAATPAPVATPVPTAAQAPQLPVTPVPTPLTPVPVQSPPPPSGSHWVHSHGWTERDTDPSPDSVFYFPTGRTLQGGELSLGFPGPSGIPDIQYGVTNFLQIGAGYTLFGFTPEARLGLIRSRRVDFTLVGGAYLPVGTTNPFYGRWGGGVLSAGRDDFRVHLGYQWYEAWGTPFPSVHNVEGGLGTTGMEVRVAPRVKFLFMIENFAQLDTPSGSSPFYAVAASPGFRVWSNTLSLDLGVMAGEAWNVQLERYKAPANVGFILPLLTIRYQL